MKLVIGGYAQGKTKYIKDRYPDAPVYEDIEELERLITDETVIWNHFNNSFTGMAADSDYDENLEKAAKERIGRITANCPGLIIVSDEIGSGLIPVEAKGRNLRELVGRFQITLAKEADEVWRIVCGQGMKIK